MSDYLREAAMTKPDNCIISLHSIGVHVEIITHRVTYQKTISWIEVEMAVINPITMAIEQLTGGTK